MSTNEISALSGLLADPIANLVKMAEDRDAVSERMEEHLAAIRATLDEMANWIGAVEPEETSPALSRIAGGEVWSTLVRVLHANDSAVITLQPDLTDQGVPLVDIIFNWRPEKGSPRCGTSYRVMAIDTTFVADLEKRLKAWGLSTEVE